MRYCLKIILLLSITLYHVTVKAQDFYEGSGENWLKKAEELKPALNETMEKPLGYVSLIQDSSAYQGWKTVSVKSIDTLHEASFDSPVILDFGEHITGFFSFTIAPSKGLPEAPVRLKFTFTEMPASLAVPFDPYPGALSRAWLQDEIVTAIVMPATITIPRRVAFRYVKIEKTGSCSFCDFSLYDLQCRATTSAKNYPLPLDKNTSPLLKKIDEVGLATLKECMQTVYEDGPKRDRRLWIGDLYLQSLSNDYSFKNYNLAKRCLYLLAALSNKDGFLNSNILDEPFPHPHDDPFLFDYALLYSAVLKDYFVATKDTVTALELWPVAKKQFECVQKYMLPSGMFDDKAAVKNGWWLFVDWNDKLDKQAPEQGIIIYTMKQAAALATMLGKSKDATELSNQIKIMTDAAHKYSFDKKQGVFVSGADKQISFASQAWMVLSGVATKAESQKVLLNVLQNTEAIKPGTPYLYHYFIEALIQAGLNNEAKNILVNYWGGMVKKGADTFWEVYDQENDFISPYNFFPVNSYCHAWSCTPVYFIRKYPEIFQTK